MHVACMVLLQVRGREAVTSHWPPPIPTHRLLGPMRSPLAVGSEIDISIAPRTVTLHGSTRCS